MWGELPKKRGANSLRGVQRRPSAQVAGWNPTWKGEKERKRERVSASFAKGDPGSDRGIQAGPRDIAPRTGLPRHACASFACLTLRPGSSGSKDPSPRDAFCRRLLAAVRARAPEIARAPEREPHVDRARPARDSPRLHPASRKHGPDLEASSAESSTGPAQVQGPGGKPLPGTCRPGAPQLLCKEGERLQDHPPRGLEGMR